MTRMHRRTGRFEAMAVAFACVLAHADASAQFPDPVGLPDGTAVRIAPGANAVFTFDVRNASTFTQAVNVAGMLRGAPGSFGEYAFVSESGPRCAAPVLYGTGDSVRFEVGPLDAGESQRCVYRVTRRVDSINDLMFGACVGTSSPWLCARDVFIGSLPDMQLIAEPAEPVAPGAMSALVRLTARNPLGPDALARSVTTACEEFEFGMSVPFPFDLENDFPGACPTSDHREMCFNFTGQNFDSRGFLIGPTAAGGEASCLIRLRYREPISRPFDLAMYFTDDIVERADGGRAFDPDRANGVVRVGAAPGGIGTPDAAALPLSPIAAMLLAALIGLVAATRLRRRTQG